MVLKSYEAFFDHFCQSPVAAKMNILTKNKFTKFDFILFTKDLKFQISSPHTTKMRVKKH
jgi:hypothetical protein